jgi:ADP-dependent NAD(P)H-hydrate dehydratase
VRGNFVLDAAALHGVLKRGSGITRQEGSVILTPHAGEMAKILNVSRQAVEEAPDAAARTVSQALNCVVVLKGATSFICDARGSMFRNEHGAVGLGTGGSGDVPAGLIAGLFARGAEPLTATLWGVYVHAHIGTILTDKVGTLGFLSREVLDEIPGVLSALVERSSLATH